MKASYEDYLNNDFIMSRTGTAPTPPSVIKPDSRNAETTSITSKKYSYHFGIDSISFSQIRIEENMCFVSEDIEIGYLVEDEYIQLTSDFNTGDNGSIEFYIMDGSDLKSILPIGTNTVFNEKIFFGLRTRFGVDENEPVIVKKNGVVVDVPLDQAINSNEDGYTVTYTPVDAHDLTIKNSTIKIKVILRTYSKNAKAPFVKRMAIKKHGRTSLWRDNTIN